jgi:hypothetical protein
MQSNSILALPLLLLVGLFSYANSASAQVQSNKTSTTCINGKCSTVSGTVTPTRSTFRKIATPTTLISKVSPVKATIKAPVRLPTFRSHR